MEFAVALADLESHLLPPPLPLPPPSSPSQAAPGVKVRKLAQLDAFAAAVWAVERRGAPGDEAVRAEEGDLRTTRVVDVGCGVGHLTRALAAKLGARGLGLELDPTRVAAAHALTVAGSNARLRPNQSSSSTRHRGRAMPSAAGTAAAPPLGGPPPLDVRFEVCDAAAPGEVAGRLRGGDLVAGLHPCGALGEALVFEVAAAAVAAGANARAANDDGLSSTAANTPPPPALLMVSCCLAGRPGVEVPAVRLPASAAGRALRLALPRAALKKTNLRPGGGGGSGEQSNLERREARVRAQISTRTKHRY